MNNYPEITLKKGKEITVKRQHHWLFSGAVAKKPDNLSEGQIIKVMDFQNRFLAIGFYALGSIMVRMISFEDRTIDARFWEEKLGIAHTLRIDILSLNNPNTNAYRLVHGEGDHLPGLVIDYYHGTAVVQAHHAGIFQQLNAISEALKNIYGTKLEAIYDKSTATLRGQHHLQGNWLYGEAKSQKITENGISFNVNWEEGQKTGFFIDQRENRMLLSKYSQNKKVLNAFCYTGGFSLYALKGGASEVHSVDISQSAIDMCKVNLDINGFDPLENPCVTGDVIPNLQGMAKDFDLIVLDPPAFAKNIRSRHNAVQAYKRINAMAIKRVAPGGIIFTFSCSQVVDRELFLHTITSAGLEVGRKVRVLHHLNQSPDHPINLFHQETAYLKGLVLHVE
jgi:23S rRNA (cytosine1962-C5)-methyltransferase